MSVMIEAFSCSKIATEVIGSGLSNKRMFMSAKRGWGTRDKTQRDNFGELTIDKTFYFKIQMKYAFTIQS